MTTAQIDSLIDTYVQQDAVSAFHNYNLNTILHLLNVGGSGSGGGGTLYPGYSVLPVNSGNFTSATAYANSALVGQNFGVFWNEAGRFLLTGADMAGDPVEVSIDAGGGFTVLIPGFNKSDANYHFYLHPAP